MTRSPRIFLLSPATASGQRAALVRSPRAQFPIAEQMRTAEGAPLGEVFAFLSGLYFRGKLAYATTFARVPACRAPALGRGVFVITPSLGLQFPDYAVTLETLEQFARVEIDAKNEAYRAPLEAAARLLDTAAGPRAEVVLLGSVATGKYVDILLAVFGPRLLFPAEFVGRGDMSRGGLMLRCVRAGTELTYVPLEGAVRHGPRPPKLGPWRPRRSD